MDSSERNPIDLPTVGSAGLFVTTATYGEVLGISEQTIRRLCRQGEIPAIKVGKTWRIPVWAITDAVGVSAHD